MLELFQSQLLKLFQVGKAWSFLEQQTQGGVGGLLGGKAVLYELIHLRWQLAPESSLEDDVLLNNFPPQLLFVSLHVLIGDHANYYFDCFIVGHLSQRDRNYSG